MRKKKGNKLIFISHINRDGSGTSPISDEYLAIMQDEVFRLSCLSLSEKTYIAVNFNSFVVRIK